MHITPRPFQSTWYALRYDSETNTLIDSRILTTQIRDKLSPNGRKKYYWYESL